MPSWWPAFLTLIQGAIERNVLAESRQIQRPSGSEGEGKPAGAVLYQSAIPRADACTKAESCSHRTAGGTLSTASTSYVESGDGYQVR